MHKQFFIMSVLIILILPVSPQSASALQPVSDQEMSTVTGRAGISMVFDNLSITYESGEINSDTTFSPDNPAFAFTDTDGADYTVIEPLVDQAYGARIELGYILLDKLTLNSFYRTGPEDLPGHFDQSNPLKWINDTHSTAFSALTFDVAGDLAPVFWGDGATPGAGLCLGLGTLDAHIDYLNIHGIYVDWVEQRYTGGNEWEFNDAERDFCKLEILGASIATLGGRVGFMSYGGCGMDIGIDDVQIYSKVDEIRIIDSDGVWNPVNDVYNNRPQIGGTDDGPVASWMVLKDIEIDTLRINSLVFAEIPDDDETPVSLFSPGSMGAFLDYSECMNNYRASDMGIFASADRRYNPLTLDITTGLPAMTVIHQASGGTGSVTGIHIGMPTSEIHMSEMTIGGIYNVDPTGGDYSNIGYVVYNQDTSYMRMQVQDSVTAIMSGRLEVSAH